MAPFDNQNTNQPGGQFRQGQDFSGSLNDMLAPGSQYQQMLAPYQQMAQKFTSPYATMNQNSWLAQNHPHLAGMLDNAFLTAGSTPSPQGPEGVGGGISRMMQGLMGGQQFQRQRMMQQAMMPYQMLSQSLQPMDIMSQIQERHGSALRAEAYNEAMVNRFGPGGLESQKVDIAQQRADQAKYGRQLSDPMDRMAHDLHPFKDPQNPTQAEYKAVSDEYMGMKEKAQRQPAGSYEEQIFQWQNSHDPAIKVMGDKAYAQHIDTLRAGAGARTGAEQGVTEPVKEQNQFLAQEDKNKYKDLPTLPTQENFYKLNDPNGIAAFNPKVKAKLDADFAASQDNYQKKIAERDTKFAAWQASPAYAAKVPFRQWLANPDGWKQSAYAPPPVTDQSSAQAQWDAMKAARTKPQ